MYPTHEVLNQSKPLLDYNLFTSDALLQKVLKHFQAEWIFEQARSYGKLAGSAENIHLGFLANENPPKLKTFDRFGNRIDQVEFHPAWHTLMQTAVEYGFHCSPWKAPQEGAHLARAVLYYMANQVEAGHCCPITMTYAALPALQQQPEIAAEWKDKIQSLHYDPRFLPVSEKKGALFGMAMTEKQGGSDVRANTTLASPIKKNGPGEEYLITGHKWFCSAPMCDAFLILAQAPTGLSCFLVPRWMPDGKQNRFLIQRLKDKCGNRSNASSEVEFMDTWGRMVGEEGRGVATIINMVNFTRLDCILGSAGSIRQAVVQAIHHCQYRSAFGKKLIDQPLMKNVLADLSIESEAATLLAMRLAATQDKEEKALSRIATAIGKYWVCKRAPVVVFEALECLGGAGYVEESIMPRLYRDAPLNSIWEGSGNVNCLDVLRAFTKEPDTKEALLSEILSATGSNSHFDQYARKLTDDLRKFKNDPEQARFQVELMALALQGSLLLRYGNPTLAEAFCVSRLKGEWGRVLGTLPKNVNKDQIFEHTNWS